MSKASEWVDKVHGPERPALRIGSGIPYAVVQASEQGTPRLCILGNGTLDAQNAILFAAWLMDTFLDKPPVMPDDIKNALHLAS